MESHKEEKFQIDLMVRILLFQDRNINFFFLNLIKLKLKILIYFLVGWVLQAPPPLRSSPERDGETEFVAVDPKAMVTDVEMVSGVGHPCVPVCLFYDL